MKPFLLFVMLMTISPLTLLHANNSFESQPSVANAFKSINYDIYLIEETKAYCDAKFPEQVSRNSEAYDSWELKYNFFLREMDNNYDLWKSGFSQLLQQQFPTLDANARKQAYLEVSKNFNEGTADKWFNFKPSLTRPRSNIELNHEQAVSLIRNKKFTSFKNDRGTTGASELCQWEQSIALETAQQRSDGVNQKTQATKLKVMRSEKSDLDKKEHALRVKKFAEIIDEAYQAQNIHAPTFSQYRFARCERDNNSFSSVKFKQVLPALESCQQSSEDFPKLAACINKSLD
jgi:hypothetical protein